MDNIDDLPVPATVQQIGEQSQACATALNALDNISIIDGDGKEAGALEWGDNNAVLTIMGSGKGGGIGPNYFNGAANGLPAYFRLNGDGPFTSLPDGSYPLNDPTGADGGV